VELVPINLAVWCKLLLSSYELSMDVLICPSRLLWA